MVKPKARFLIKIVQMANVFDIYMVLQKKREGDNEEVSGVPEQVDWSVLDNVVIICGSIDQCMYVCLVSSNYY